MKNTKKKNQSGLNNEKLRQRTGDSGGVMISAMAEVKFRG